MNPDTVTIRNKKTGETRVVPKAQLGSYGLSSPQANKPQGQLPMGGIFGPASAVLTSPTASQDIMGTLKEFGLGGGQNLMGAIDSTLRPVGENIGNEIRGWMGKEKLAPSGGNAFWNQEEKAAVQADPLGAAGKDLAGVASWAAPLSKVGVIPSAVGKLSPGLSGAANKLPGIVKAGLGRAEAGAEMGALQGIGQGGDVEDNAAMGAALNTILPGLSRGVQTLGFKGATGKSLGTLEKIEKEAGQKLTATSREGMKGQLANIQKSLGDNLVGLMDDGGTMTKKEVENYLDRFQDPADDLYKKLGTSEQKVADIYISELKNVLDDVVNAFNKEGPTAIQKPGYYGSAQAAMEGTQDNALGPFYNFMRKIENDVPQSYWDKLKNMMGQDGNSGKSKVATELRKFLRKNLSELSSDSPRFEKIMDQRKEVGEMSADITDEGMMKSLKQALQKSGFPLLGGPLSILGVTPAIGVPAAGVGTFMAIAEKYPQVAPMLRNLLDNPTTAGIGDSLIKALSAQGGQD